MWKGGRIVFGLVLSISLFSHCLRLLACLLTHSFQPSFLGRRPLCAAEALEATYLNLHALEDAESCFEKSELDDDSNDGAEEGRKEEEKEKKATQYQGRRKFPVDSRLVELLTSNTEGLR